MKVNDPDTKEKILAATVALLREEESPDRLTVRQIAERAGVAVGAINYHFQSKDCLVNRAIQRMIADTATPWYESTRRGETDTATLVRQLTKDGVTAAFRYHKMSTHSLTYWVLNSEFEIETQLLPLLREVLGQHKSETEIRLLAFELVTTVQVAVLRRGAFRRFVGLDLDSPPEREAMLDTLIDHLLQVPETSRAGSGSPENPRGGKTP